MRERCRVLEREDRRRERRPKQLKPGDRWPRRAGKYEISDPYGGNPRQAIKEPPSSSSTPPPLLYIPRDHRTLSPKRLPFFPFFPFFLRDMADVQSLPLFPDINLERKSSAEMLCLELSLAPPPAPPSLSQEGSSSEPRELSLELWLWPAWSPTTAQKEKNLITKAGSVDTANSRTRQREEEEEVGENGVRWEWEEKVMALTNGTATAVQRVLEKKLYATDVSAGHCRLLLAENVEAAGGGKRKGPALLLDALTREEKAAAEKDGGGGLAVLLIDRRGREYPSAKLKLWRSSDSYVIIGKWTELVHRNELDPGDIIDIYLFRHGSSVGLVVCSRISAAEEERRRGDDREARERRREVKADRMRGYKRRRGSSR